MAQDTATNTLDNTDLGGLLVVKLAQAEGEGTELLDNLREGLAGAGTLQTVGGGGTAVQGGAVVKVLDLTGSQAEADLNTPNLTNIGDTLTTDTLAGDQDDLLVTLDLVAVEHPAGSVLNNLAVVSLGDLLQEISHVRLGRGLLGGGLSLLLVGTLGQQTGGDHQAEQELVGVVSSDNKVSLTAGDDLLGGVLLGDDVHVTDNSSESINLGTELDLDDLASLQSDLGLGGIGHKGSVGSDIGAGRDGSGVRDTFYPQLDFTVRKFISRKNQKNLEPTLGDLLALVDLGDFLIEELVTLLANLDDLLALNTQSYWKLLGHIAM